MKEIVKDLNIPSFSLIDLQNGLKKEEFLTCLMQKGIFYLTDYQIQTEADHQILLHTTTMEFFQKSSEELKESVTNRNPAIIRRGFTKLGSESTAKATNAGDFSDYSMCFTMGTSDNLFPSNEFKNVWTKYFNQLNIVANAIAYEVLNAAGFNSSNYGGDVKSFVECEPDSYMRFSYFPEVPEERCAEHVPLRMATHRDHSTITLIHQTPCPNGFVSLQCEIEGTFVDVPAIPNSIIVLCGAAGTYVSDGKIKAPKHRVVAPDSAQRKGSSRTSSVFFLRPKADFIISVPTMKALGFSNGNHTGETATYKEWFAASYPNLEDKD